MASKVWMQVLLVGGFFVGFAAVMMIVYGTTNMYKNQYTEHNCGNPSNISINDNNNCNYLSFDACVYHKHICTGDYHIIYPLNNTCCDYNFINNTVNNIINSTFTCYINNMNGTIIDSSIIDITPTKFMIAGWIMFVFVMLYFAIYCCVQNCCDRRYERHYYINIA